MRSSILTLLLLTSFSGGASTFWVPDSDTAALYQLLSTSISQLNEMEKLVTSAEKFTRKTQEYNELVEDQLDRARRVKEYAEYQIYLVQAKPENLREINDLIRDLNSSIADLEQLRQEYQVTVVESELNEEKAKSNSKDLQKNTNRLKKQALNSRSQVKGTTEQIRINTANSAVEAAKTNEILNKVSLDQDKQTSMTAKENLRKVTQEKEREEFYQLNFDSKKRKKKNP